MVEPEIIMNELKDEKARNLMAEAIFDEIEISKKIIIDCLLRIEQNTLKSKLNVLRNKLKKNELNEKQTMELIQKINDLQKQIKNLKNKYIDV